MYYGPGIPQGIRPEFRSGDVSSIGLWDETVDQPEAFPFVADSAGFCYIPDYGRPTADPRAAVRGRSFAEKVRPPLAAWDPEKPELRNTARCDVGCSWSSS
jgi:hypothetical protein